MTKKFTKQDAAHALGQIEARRSPIRAASMLLDAILGDIRVIQDCIYKVDHVLNSDLTDSQKVNVIKKTIEASGMAHILELYQ